MLDGYLPMQLEHDNHCHDALPSGAGEPTQSRRKRRIYEALACSLVWELERIDPTGSYEMDHGPLWNWRRLSSGEREIYISAVELTLLRRGALIRAALNAGMTKDHGIDRR